MKDKLITAPLATKYLVMSNGKESITKKFKDLTFLS